MPNIFSRLRPMAMALVATSFFLTQPSASKDVPLVFPVHVDGKWGVVDEAGEFVIPADFTIIRQRKDGDFDVKNDDQWAVFTPDGTVRFRFGEGRIGDFKGGYGEITAGFSSSIIDQNGRVILGGDGASFRHFDGANLFSVKKGKFGGIIDQKCEWLLEPSEMTEWISEPDPSGLFRVGSFKHQYGVMRLDGSWVIEQGVFDDVGEPSLGLIPVKSDGKWGFLNASGEWVIQPIDEKRYGWERFHAESGLTPVTVGGKEGLMRRDGSFAVDPVFDDIGRIDKHGAIATRDGKQGYIDHAGNVLVPFEYDRLGRFHDTAIIEGITEKERVFLNIRGEELFTNRFDRVGFFSKRNWAPASKDGRWGAINAGGEWILKPKYYCVENCYLRDDFPRQSVFSSQVPYSKPGPNFFSNPQNEAWCHAGK